MRARTIEFTMLNEDGDSEEYSIPAKFEVCPRCDGEGVHSNPSAGHYDVPCEECRGQRLVLVPDLDRADASDRAAWEEHLLMQEQEAEWAASDAAYSRMERGY